MKLKGFNKEKEINNFSKKNNGKIIAMILPVFLFAIFIVNSSFSHAKYTNMVSKLMIYSTVEPSYRLSLNYYVNGTLSTKPTNNGTYVYRYASCTPDYTGTWNNSTWAFTGTGEMSDDTTCDLYFTPKTHCELYGFDKLSDCLIAVGGNNATTVAAAKTFINSKTTATATKPVFSQAVTADLGMFMMADDFGNGYYYRGSVTNNNVIFGGFQWKVLRVEGNGNVKLIYNGICNNPATCTINTTGKATTINNGELTTWSPKDPPGISNTFFGYMYNVKSTTLANEILNVNDSNIKLKLETWYAANILGRSFESKIADTIFCNDRQIQSGNGYNVAATIYKPYNRNATNKAPKIKCDCTLDSNRQRTYCYSTNPNTGGTNYSNGVIKYPVGTLTVDEATVAGGLFNGANTGYYLYTGVQFWTLSPAQYTSTTPKQPVTFLVRADGSIYNGYIYDSSSSGSASTIRPVISLNYNTTFSRGTGTALDPYVIE